MEITNRMGGIPGNVYECKDSYWYCSDPLLFICMTHEFRLNEGYEAEEYNLVTPALILEQFIETHPLEGDSNDKD